MANEPTTPAEGMTTALILPCDQKHFAKFVSGLLGKPQTIMKLKRGSFDIGHDEIVSFYHLVNQRVTQQNAANLVQFTVNVVYNDGASILHNSLEGFQAYNEVRPVWSTEVLLSWTYLITFQQKKVPEKQTIEVRIDTDKAYFFTRSSSFSSASPSSTVMIRIEHTEWTWGADIEGRLSAHIETLLEKEYPLKNWLRKHSDKIGLAFSALAILGGTLMVYIKMNHFAAHQNELVAIDKSTVASTFEIVVDKLNRIQEAMAQGAWYRFTMTSFLHMLASIVIALVGGAVISNVVDYSPPAFLRLTPHSEKHRVKLLKKTQRQWLKFVFTFAAGVLASVVANFVYVYLLGQSGR